MFFEINEPFRVVLPDWPQATGVMACMTQRNTAGEQVQLSDGRSGFNVGAHVGDEPGRVAAHRAAFDEHFGVQSAYLNQVHGVHAQHITAKHCADLHPDADASWTTDLGVACAVMVADCLPVLACSHDGGWVGCAHAGWRGLAAGVLHSLVAAHQHHAGLETVDGAETVVETAHPRELLVWLGPCIGPTAFEVGNDVREAFLATGLDAKAVQACFKPAGADKWLANLSALARLHLQAMGVTAIHGNDGTAPWCTVHNPERWFSYRRDQARLGGSGRMAAYIWRQTASDQ